MTRRHATPFPLSALPPRADDVTLEPDEHTDERHPYVTHADLEAALHPVRSDLASIIAHVGPHAQAHRARRDAAFIASSVAFVGCIGIGLLGMQEASSASVVAVSGVVLLTVAGIFAAVGRVQLTATAPGVSVDAHATDRSRP